MPSDITAGFENRASAPLRAPTLAESLLRIAQIKLALSVLGFAAVRRIMKARVGTRIRINDDTDFVMTTERCVAMAAGLFPGRAACLEQSLVLYYVLRRQGVGAQFRMGVRAQPFGSHAWVEYRGQPINDSAENVECLAQLPAQLP